ncbi:hypothetical protein AU196_16675 [Mycobacterium sp. IS-1742]|uniref:hypothetical protein n=1 Tax=Mycobacterium sp. IS-1742 TaxID=1772285 RepID=UPI000740230C|nr:hypothetical protein [Mycobacterium sp. IS-1742]KUI32495.1 hypothetical protein AU196_16675 [Mycobacterium sp. IS-1742]
MSTTHITTAAAVGALLIGGVAAGATTSASVGDVALNGVFTAVSDGEWAKTRESFRDEATVVSTWTISSTCTTYQDCTGSVTSDQGWTADLVYRNLMWRVTRVIEGWERCPDGTAFPGEQSFTFWPARADAPDRHDRLSGWDQTIGPSGACGVNRWQNIRMPFRLSRIT